MWPGYEARKDGVAWSVLHRLLRDDILGKKFAEFKYYTWCVDSYLHIPT